MIETLLDYNNCFFINTGCTFSKLNESEYLKGILKNLKNDFPKFYDYNFYIVSSQEFNLPLNVTTPSETNILIFISDEHGFEYNNPLFSNIFKCYGGGKPFPLGCVKDVPFFPYRPIQERKYDVFFSGNLNPNRVDFYSNLLGFGINHIHPKILVNRLTRKIIFKTKHLHDLSYKFKNSMIIFNDGFKKGLNPSLYGQILSDTKIVLSPKGFHSAECFRTYEAMRAGCIVISEKLPNNYLYESSPIIQVDNWRNIRNVIEQLLSDPENMQALSRMSVDWYNDNFSEKAAAYHIAETICL